jgi:hypothetical protein
MKNSEALCNITKQVIDDLDIFEVTIFLNKLLDKPREFQENLRFGVGGYENDQRELWEIPQVRYFIKILDERFPFWFHFCERENKTRLDFALLN